MSGRSCGAPAADPLDTSVAEAVRQAVQHRRVLRIEYVDVRGERTTREVEPQLLVAGPRGWYLTGWCRLRQDVRAFRLDRVRSAVQTPEGFAERPSDLDSSAPPELIPRIPVWE
ncbi:helix-turn-helix transcriptional regulator [Thermomonospora amylolytica]|uniref:helix-turn-helix transcriptional regulator n=1 Tax=Thermomonospora amylolytica TaxID=1411117 RepID=UPI000E6BDD6A|nr:WYL domain-containing protein [Thermomonospora amylolytica]